MKFCVSCGNKIVNNYKYCTHCGKQIVNETIKTENNKLIIASIVLGSLGIFGALTVVLCPIGIIISLIGLILGIIANKKTKNVIGIVLSILGFVFSLSTLIVMIVLIKIIISNYDYDSDNYYDSYYNYHSNKEYY